MGLDMYLLKKTYINSSEWVKEEKRDNIEITQGGKPHPTINPKRIHYIIEEAGYWRKSNAIHRWFVENVQKGIDDCGEYRVSLNQLIKLKEVCTQVLDDKSKADELLPTMSGSFFGSTDYDEYYFGDLIQTIEIIEEVLNYEDGSYYSYQSSW
jgi:hypothetical protein